MNELRGKCYDMSYELCKKDPSLELVRGFYYCSHYGREQHWWCKAKDGTIIDPTKDQYPSKGTGVYEEFDGICDCEQCGKQFKEEDGILIGRYMCCSTKCCKDLVGL